jgi:hypothetical protein
MFPCDATVPRSAGLGQIFRSLYNVQMLRRTAIFASPLILGVYSFHSVAFNAEQWPFDTKVIPLSDVVELDDCLQ